MAIAQVVHDPLPRHLQRPGLEVLGGKGGHEHGQVEHREAVEPRQLPLRDVAVDGDFDEVGLRPATTRC